MVSWYDEEIVVFLLGGGNVEMPLSLAPSGIPRYLPHEGLI